MTWDEILNLFTKPLFTLGKSPVSLATLVQFALVLAIAVLLSRLTRRLLRTRVLSRTKLNIGLQYAIARITSYIVLVLGLVIGLSTLGIDLTSLTVLAGALGVGIGFGLQNIVNNFVSGLIILAERPIEIGDRVEVANTAGRVVRIGARSTTILTNDNIMYIVPNSEFISERVVNWTHADPRVRFSVPVGVSYGSDPHVVKKLLLEVAAVNKNVLTDPGPTVAFKRFGDSSLDFELRVWTATMPDRPTAFKSELYFAIWDKFKQHGIEIPFPQRDLHIKGPVRVEGKPF
jgi:small-conductance mechanosensitive channel